MSELPNYGAILEWGIIGIGWVWFVHRFFVRPLWPQKRKKVAFPRPALPELEERPALVKYDDMPTVQTAGWSDERWRADESWWSDGYHAEGTSRRAPRSWKMRSVLTWPFAREACRLFEERESGRIALVPLAQPWHYEVHTLAGRTGLRIEPVAATASSNGCHRVDGWVIRYTGRLLAGPYDFIEEVQLLATLLICFDWSREPSAFSRREVQEVKAIMQAYNAELVQYRAALQEAVREAFLETR